MDPLSLSMRLAVFEALGFLVLLRILLTLSLGGHGSIDHDSLGLGLLQNYDAGDVAQERGQGQGALHRVAQEAAWHHVRDLVGETAVDTVQADAALHGRADAAVGAVAVDEPDELAIGQQDLQASAPCFFLETAPPVLGA